MAGSLLRWLDMKSGLRSDGTVVVVVACLAALMSTACSPGPEAATRTAPAAAPSPHVGRFVRHWSGIGAPVATVAAPGDQRIFVVDKGGRVLVSSDGEAAPTPWLDLSGEVSTGGEQGLLGMALHPHYATNGRAFLDYTDRSGDTRIVEIDVDPVVAAPGTPASVRSRRELLHIAQPFPNHNGGNLVFGPDARLWIGTGDGGGANDPEDNARNPDSLLGKMLRLDVDSDAAPEIWALGLRNPWRYSFDPATGDLWIGDVGQDAVEEVDVVRDAVEVAPVLDFGWPAREGDRANPDRPGPAPAGAIEPVLTYPTHVGGTCAVTGGGVYRGPLAADYVGRYFFGDACSGHVWTTDAADPTVATDVTAILDLPAGLQVVSFGVDSVGRLYLVDLGGAVFRLESGN